MIEIKVPAIGESITEVTLIKWTKKDGDYVERDEIIAEFESEKATFEVNAEKAGILKTNGSEGDTLKIGDVLATIDETAVKESGGASRESDGVSQESAVRSPEAGGDSQESGGGSKESGGVSQESGSGSKESGGGSREAGGGRRESGDISPESGGGNQQSTENDQSTKATPVAAAMIADKKIDPKSITPSGAQGKIMKDDVLSALSNPGRVPGKVLFSREERREKMSNLRKTVSRRLVEAKNTTAMLTTFNEVDMSRIMALRTQYKEKFKEKHGTNLGFMSFFTKAVCFALQEWPSVNAYIDGESVVYHDYCDISIAVSAPKGLVVPVIRNAESLSMAEIEKEVVRLAGKARDSKLTLEEMQGGTFTITNGGVFGSLMSTPIINIPQSAILGMHKIQERPMAVNGQVVIKPMMYLALSYDHRIIDGRESVSFLVRVKELLENPELLLFGKDPVKTLLEV